MTVWNAVFRAVEVNGLYLPLDVDDRNLPGLVGALRRTDRLLGLHVAVPHKVEIIEPLDDLDSRRGGSEV